MAKKISVLRVAFVLSKNLAVLLGGYLPAAVGNRSPINGIVAWRADMFGIIQISSVCTAAK